MSQSLAGLLGTSLVSVLTKLLGSLASVPQLARVSSQLYPNTRKNSSADLRGSDNRSDITATASAPISSTAAAFWRVIPPMATSGFRVNDRALRTPCNPTNGSGFSLLL